MGNETIRICPGCALIVIKGCVGGFTDGDENRICPQMRAAQIAENYTPPTIAEATRCSRELKLISGVRCSRTGSVKRDGEWFCSFHDPGPKVQTEASLMARFAHVEITDEEELA